jgi:hypothetical protein
MKISIVRCLIVASLLAFVACAVLANASTINISFSAGSGIITGTAELTLSGTTVTGITGSITDTDINSSPEAITGLASYAGDDQIFNENTYPYVDFAGLSFATPLSDFNIGYAPPLAIAISVNNPNGYVTGAPGLYDLDSLTVPDGGTTLALLGLAIAGLAGLRRKLRA